MKKRGSRHRQLGLLVHPADVQDRDSAVPLLMASRSRHPFVAKAFADSGYNSDRIADAINIDVQIVHKTADQTGFAVHASSPCALILPHGRAT